MGNPGYLICRLVGLLKLSVLDGVVCNLWEFFVGVVVEAERVDDIFAYGVDDEGTVY